MNVLLYLSPYLVIHSRSLSLNLSISISISHLSHSPKPSCPSPYRGEAVYVLRRQFGNRRASFYYDAPKSADRTYFAYREIGSYGPGYYKVPEYEVNKQIQLADTVPHFWRPTLSNWVDTNVRIPRFLYQMMTDDRHGVKIVTTIVVLTCIIARMYLDVQSAAILNKDFASEAFPADLFELNTLSVHIARWTSFGIFMMTFREFVLLSDGKRKLNSLTCTNLFKPRAFRSCLYHGLYSNYRKDESYHSKNVQRVFVLHSPLAHLSMRLCSHGMDVSHLAIA